MSKKPRHPCAGRSRKQREAFERVATGSKGEGENPDTMAALERAGLVIGGTEILPGRFPVKIRTYHVPTPIHRAWCEWCAAQPDLEEPAHD